MSQQPDQPDGSEPPPAFDPDAQHQQTPRLRKIRAVPVPAQGPDGDEMTMLGLADAQQIATKMVVTHPAFQQVLGLMDGSRAVDEIVAQVGKGLERPMLEQLIVQLDQAGLIHGPNFDAMLAKMREDFDNTDTLPPGSTAQAADLLVMQEHGQDASDEIKAEEGPPKLREAMDKWIDEALKEASDPAFDALPSAIVAPHMDYPRGWLNYAHVYGRMRVAERPDRVVILGTNHFGQSSGVCGCDKGYETPFGTCPADTELIDTLRTAARRASRAGSSSPSATTTRTSTRSNFISRGSSTSSALTTRGKFPKVFGALDPRPARQQRRVLRRQRASRPRPLRRGAGSRRSTSAGRHNPDRLQRGPLPCRPRLRGPAGPWPGTTRTRQQLRARRSPSTTRRRSKSYVERRLDDMVGAMSWQQNPTRVGARSGNMTAAMRLADPDRVELLNYAAAMDPQGQAFVSSAAVAMF